jgi:predicted metal-dependent hydrolase
VQKQIELLETQVEYTLRTSNKTRRLRLTIHHDGAFVVSAPPSMPQNVIEQFIISKSHWVIDKLGYFKQFPNRTILKSTKKDFTKNKQTALTMVRARLAYFNSFYNFRFNNVAIRAQKTRWGSCSKKGNLNFNYQILSLPQHLSDYIIVHELCHLAEFNHSKRFWDLVAQTVPNHKALRHELKSNWHTT